jgi:phenylacetic acid degradation protein PaaD
LHSVTDNPDEQAERDAAALAERCAAAMWASDQASQSLGIEIAEVSPGRALARLTVTAALVNGHEMAHGGYVFLLADTAFAFACNTYGYVTVAHGAEITFVAPAQQGDELEAVAVERHRAGRNGIYDVTVRRRASGEVVAEFRGHSRQLSTRLVD